MANKKKDTKGIIRGRKLETGLQYNGQKEKDTKGVIRGRKLETGIQ
jgi:hypothetical protein